MASPDKNSQEPIKGIPWRAFKILEGNEFKDFAKKNKYHPLDVEDCYHKRQISKVVERDNYVFVVAKTASFDIKTARLHFDDLDMFIAPDSLVTVEEHPEALVERVSKRFPLSGNVQATDMHHIVYALLDEIVDDYLVKLDHIGEAIHAIETDVWKDSKSQMLERIFKLRHLIIDFRRTAGGMREVVSILIRHPRVKTNGDLESYYRDLYEHLIRIIEFTETYRDVLNGSLEVYLSAVALRTNEISKALAVYGAIALPFLILTGMYGMNIPLPFQDSPHAFFIVFVSMSVFGVGALLFFRRKGWF
ncbi:MAG: magnesium transporter CorA family protein [bacterium]|nr:magnesium transporter CorA family protein [bacterium]